MSSEHEFFPEDESKIEQLNYQYEVISRMLRGDKPTGRPGLIDDVRSIKNEMEKMNALLKQVRVGFVCLIIGIIVGGVIWGVYTLKEALGVIK